MSFEELQRESGVIMSKDEMNDIKTKSVQEMKGLIVGEKIKEKKLQDPNKYYDQGREITREEV